MTPPAYRLGEVAFTASKKAASLLVASAGWMKMENASAAAAVTADNYRALALTKTQASDSNRGSATLWLWWRRCSSTSESTCSKTVTS